MSLPAPTQPMYLPGPSQANNNSASTRVPNFNNNNNNRGQQNSKGKSPSGNRARVFNMTKKDAEESNNVVSGNLLTVGHLSLVLFDSGATHSFISNKFVEKYSVNKHLLRELLHP